MSQFTDGTFTSAVQDGSKQVSLPLQSDGNYFATLVHRNYIAAPYTAFAPIIGQTTSYTALLKYSDDFSQSPWTKAATTGTASAATDPEGGTTATKLAEDNTNAAHKATQAMTVASGALAFGVLAKASERNFIRLRINNATDNDLAIAVFNLSTGVVLSGTGTIKQLLNGWYWCSVTGTATIADSSCIVDLTSDGSTFSYTGTTGSGVYLWRASCYRSAAIGPAIQTTSATRAVTSYPVDADDPLAFLIAESAPDVNALNIGVARWGRDYANVPAPCIQYSTISINKPAISALGTAINLQLVTGGGTSSNYGSVYTYITHLWDTFNNKIYGPLATVSGVDSGADFRVTWASHGLAGTETIAINASYNAGGSAGFLIFPTGTYSVVNGSTIDLTGWAASMVSVSDAGKYLRLYSPGVDRLGARITSAFYLPGITLGYSSPTDIAIPSPLLNDAEFLAAVVANLTGYVTYDARDLSRWRGSPIYQLDTIAINMADV